MKNLTKLLSLLALMAIVGLAGCSDQDPTSPTDVAAPVQVDDPEVAEILARMQESVIPQIPELADNQHNWDDVQRLMDEHGFLDMPADKCPAVPELLHMAIFAARATAAVNSGDTWEPLTVFLDDVGGGNVGFSVAWLEPHPDGGDDEYLCKVYVDRPDPWSEDHTPVTPYAQPVVDAAMRQGVALQTPGDIYYSSNYESIYTLYNYVFKYHSPIGDRVAQMLCFNLAVIQP